MKIFYQILSLVCILGIPATWMLVGYYNNGYAALAFFLNFILTVFALAKAEQEVNRGY